MKLWFVSQDVNNGYDTYDSFVVVAETEEQARRSAPDPQYHEWDALFTDNTGSTEKIYGKPCLNIFAVVTSQPRSWRKMLNGK